MVHPPKVVIVTTPNGEFGDEHTGPGPKPLRNSDHEREWTREEFRTWGLNAAAELAIAEAQQEEQEEEKIEASVSSDLDLSDIDEAMHWRRQDSAESTLPKTCCVENVAFGSQFSWTVLGPYWAAIHLSDSHCLRTVVSRSPWASQLLQRLLTLRGSQR